MKKYLYYSIACGACLLLLISAGCKQGGLEGFLQPPTQQNATPGFERVEDVELAQALVWPQPHVFNLINDPFKPLIGKGKFVSAMMQDGTQIEIYLRGIMSAAGKSFALIESPTKTKTYKEGDTVEGYTIKKIEPKQVIFKKGDKEIVAKIKGDKDHE